jgi:hypothetical protein
MPQWFVTGDAEYPYVPVPVCQGDDPAGSRVTVPEKGLSFLFRIVDVEPPAGHAAVGVPALKTLLAANRRLNTAYLLKESFGQLWSYECEGWARCFFENWKASLKWQRLKPYEKFAEMIGRHWDGIAAYYRPKKKVSLGFVEDLNNKIRVIQRRAYGLCDEEYLRLKILTSMRPAL